MVRTAAVAPTFLTLLLSLVAVGPNPTLTSHPARASGAPLRLPLAFVASTNASAAKYVVRRPDRTLYFTDDTVVFALNRPEDGAGPEAQPQPEPEAQSAIQAGRWNVRLSFVGSRPGAVVRGEDRQGRVSYFRGPEVPTQP